MTPINTPRLPREAETGANTVPAIVRILIASYFLAAATGLVQDPVGTPLLEGLLGADNARLVLALVIFPIAFLMMMGCAVRPMALLLSVYVFYTAFINFQYRTDPGALSAFWRDTALLGAVLLIAVTQPGGSRALVRRHVVPRRVRAVLNTIAIRPAPRALPAPEPEPESAADEVISFECFRSLRSGKPGKPIRKAA